jgi:rhodanese-related sulfurtransferase
MNFRHLFHQSSVTEVTPEEARAKQKAGAVVVDVREPSEWNAGTIPGAVLIPLGRLAAQAQELDASREIITVCRSGSRSKSAAQILQRAGFAHVESMAGGMMSWQQRQFPIKRK